MADDVGMALTVPEMLTSPSIARVRKKCQWAIQPDARTADVKYLFCTGHVYLVLELVLTTNLSKSICLVTVSVGSESEKVMRSLISGASLRGFFN